MAAISELKLNLHNSKCSNTLHSQYYALSDFNSELGSLASGPYYITTHRRWKSLYNWYQNNAEWDHATAIPICYVFACILRQNVIWKVLRRFEFWILYLRTTAPGGVLWYFHTYVGSAHFFGFKILNFSIFGVFRKINIFLGCEDFVDILLGSSQSYTCVRVTSMQFRVFF